VGRSHLALIIRWYLRTGHASGETIMRSPRNFPLIATLWWVCALQGCASTDSAASAASAPAPARITVLYDAFGQDAEMTKDWSYSALVGTRTDPKQCGSRRPGSGHVNGGALGAGSLAPRPRRP